MKKYLFLLLLLSIITGFKSCKQDFLSPKDPSAIGEEDVWTDVNLIELLVNNMYNDRPGYEYSNTLDNIVDEGRCNYPGDAPNQVLVGQWDQINNPVGFWAYQEVRKTNEFLARIDDAAIDETIRTRLKGEVRFLRAFLYFDMAKRYGGIPIIDALQSIDDDLQVERNTLRETFDFIVNELKIAAEELPKEAVRGRATKGAALALRGRALLYLASPLFNTEGNSKLWEQAAAANMEVIALKKYSLYPDLNRLWLDKSSDHVESIFEVQYRLPEKQHSWDAGLRPLVLANNNAGQLSPLQELVDAFPMRNGKLINDVGSTYNPQDPYVGRDNRFYAYIAFNGSKVKGTTSGPPIKEITLETYKGGRDYDASKENIIYNTITGYYTRKATNPDNTIYTGSTGSDQPWIELRYAEVLLNYAEAQNEALAHPDGSIYDALNLIRERAGVTDKLIPGTYSKTEMRKLIRNERYVELCFEKKRYWDLRRWKEAENKLNGKRYHGVAITKNEDGTFSYDYQLVDAIPNVFESKMYWMPIPQSEIVKNKKLKQNLDWD